MNSRTTTDTRMVLYSRQKFFGPWFNHDGRCDFHVSHRYIKPIKWGRSDKKRKIKLGFRDYAPKLEIIFACFLTVILSVFFRHEIMALCYFTFELCGGEAILEIVDILVLLVFCGWFVAYSNGEYGRLKKRDWQRFRTEFLFSLQLQVHSCAQVEILPVPNHMMRLQVPDWHQQCRAQLDVNPQLET